MLAVPVRGADAPVLLLLWDSEAYRMDSDVQTLEKRIMKYQIVLLRKEGDWPTVDYLNIIDGMSEEEIGNWVLKHVRRDGYFLEDEKQKRLSQ